MDTQRLNNRDGLVEKDRNRLVYLLSPFFNDYDSSLIFKALLRIRNSASYEIAISRLRSYGVFPDNTFQRYLRQWFILRRILSCVPVLQINNKFPTSLPQLFHSQVSLMERIDMMRRMQQLDSSYAISLNFQLLLMSHVILTREDLWCQPTLPLINRFYAQAQNIVALLDPSKHDILLDFHITH
jgi:hypothetical protein